MFLRYPKNQFLYGRLLPMPTVSGLTGTGVGAAAAMPIMPDTGNIGGGDAPGFGEDGSTTNAATDGTGDIGIKIQPGTPCPFWEKGHILSGTSMPRRFIPFFKTFAEATDSCRRKALLTLSSACKIERS